MLNFIKATKSRPWTIDKEIGENIKYVLKQQGAKSEDKKREIFEGTWVGTR